jgi:protein involved in polysaccharide export with SLBB domain
MRSSLGSSILENCRLSAIEMLSRKLMNVGVPAAFALVLVLLVGCAATPPPNSDQPLDAADSGKAVANEFSDYLLDQGDRIFIQVFDEEDLTLETVVGASGAINYSYLGDLRVSGKSPAELEQQIARLLRDGYLVNPSVNVRIVEYRPFYINGEVRAPGSYPYQPGLTMDRAITLAGGLTDRASTRKMFLLSGRGDSQQEKRVNLNSKVQAGDIVTIKEGFF